MANYQKDKNKNMKYADLEKPLEGLKRDWLEAICEKYPEHSLTYVPMLTDTKPNKEGKSEQEQREDIVKSFEDKMSERVSNNIKVYGRNEAYEKNPASQLRYFREILKEHRKHEGEKTIFFLAPDAGFYEDGTVGKVNETIDKKHIALPYIKLLLFNIENPPIIVCYQYNHRREHTDRIETRINSSITGLGISFDNTSYVSRAKQRQAKFYIFEFNSSEL